MFTHQDLRELRAFFRLEPQGWEAVNLAQAAIRETVFATIPQKEGAKRPGMREFRLDFAPPEPEEPADVNTIHRLMMNMGR